MRKKSIITSLSALIIVALLGSCDLFDKADDVSFSSDLKKSINVNESSSNSDISYSSDFTIDFSSDAEADKYREKVKDVTVNKVTYKISNFDGTAGTTFTGDLSFGPASGGSFTVATALTNVDLKAASDSGNEFEIPLNQTDINTVTELLKNDKAIKVLVAGTLSQGPVSFILEVKANVKLTADAL